MPFVSNIVLDLTAKSAVLTITDAGNSVETVTFISNTITFSTRPDINISKQSFLDYVAQMNVLQTAIFFNYSTLLDVTGNFNSANTTEAHDVPNNKWSLVSIYGATPRVINYSANGSNQTVDLLNRANPKTISFSEWIYFLFSLNHYKDSVSRFFS